MFFFFFTRQNMRARKIGRVSEVLRTGARPIGIGRAICQGLWFNTKLIIQQLTTTEIKIPKF